VWVREGCRGFPGAKDLHSPVSPLTTDSRSEGARKRGTGASFTALTDVASRLALSDSCASGTSQRGDSPGALLVLPPPRECATLLLQVRQNRLTQGTLYQHCRPVGMACIFTECCLTSRITNTGGCLRLAIPPLSKARLGTVV
jgi:hypothetical protein